MASEVVGSELYRRFGGEGSIIYSGVFKVHYNQCSRCVLVVVIVVVVVLVVGIVVVVMSVAVVVVVVGVVVVVVVVVVVAVVVVVIIVVVVRSMLEKTSRRNYSRKLSLYH